MSKTLKIQPLNETAYEQALAMLTELQSFQEYDAVTQTEILNFVTNGIVFYLDAVGALIGKDRDINELIH